MDSKTTKKAPTRAAPWEVPSRNARQLAGWPRPPVRRGRELPPAGDKVEGRRQRLRSCAPTPWGQGDTHTPMFTRATGDMTQVALAAQRADKSWHTVGCHSP